jgi:hypothetical protein
MYTVERNLIPVDKSHTICQSDWFLLYFQGEKFTAPSSQSSSYWYLHMLQAVVPTHLHPDLSVPDAENGKKLNRMAGPIL